MDNPFSRYRWTGVSLISAQRTVTTAPGERHYTAVPHNYYQIGLKHHGKTDVLYNGKYLKYHDNTVLYLPKESCDAIEYQRTIVEPGVGACAFFDSAFELPPEPFILDCRSDPRVPELFYKLAQLRTGGGSNGNPQRELDCMAVFYRLLSELSEAFTSSGGSGALRRRLAPAVEYIDRHCADSFIDLAELASAAGMSADYFRHCFKSAYGQSPLEYITRIKLENAKTFLLEGRTVTEAARLAGFSSGNYFARVFREKTGISPARFKGSARLE